MPLPCGHEGNSAGICPRCQADDLISMLFRPPLQGCPNNPGQPHRFTVAVMYEPVGFAWRVSCLQCETCEEQREVKHG